MSSVDGATGYEVRISGGLVDLADRRNHDIFQRRVPFGTRMLETFTRLPEPEAEGAMLSTAISAISASART